MKTGAVIVAAGLSSRMKEFKPMLYVGKISIIHRIILALHRAGVEPIIVVTGYKSERLNRHLENMPVRCVKNENYEYTHMFDSIKIGVKALQEICKCDQFFVMPGDVPLIESDMISKMMEYEIEYILHPVFNKRKGHPIRIPSLAIPFFLNYDGTNGLHGAIEASSFTQRYMPVQNEGILLDADTVDNYYYILKKNEEFNNKGKLYFQMELNLMVTQPFFNNSSAQLLELIEETGSIQIASDCLHLSYTSAWKKLNLMENQLGMKLCERHCGGVCGGGTKLTDNAQMLLEKYSKYYSAVQEVATEAFNKYFEEGKNGKQK